MGRRGQGLIAVVAVALSSLVPLDTMQGVAFSNTVDRQSSNCASGQQPNVTGTVVDPFGNPFPTEVTVRYSYSPEGEPFGWGTIATNHVALTNAFGRYDLCLDFDALPIDSVQGSPRSLQVIAKTTTEMWQELGDSPSVFRPIHSCLTVCTLDVVMAPPFVRGVVAEASSVRVSADSYGIFLAEVDVGDDGTFSLVANPVDRFAEGFGVGVGIRVTAFPRDETLLPLKVVRVFNGSTIVIDDAPEFETPNFRLRLRTPAGDLITTAEGFPVALVRTSGADCVDPDLFFTIISESSACGYRPFATSAGVWLGKIPDGDWTIMAGVSGFAADLAHFTLADDGTTLMPTSTTLTVGGGSLDMRLSTGRIRFLVSGVEEVAWARIIGIENSGSRNVFPFGQLSRLAGAEFGWNPQADGIYRIQFRHGAIDTFLTFSVVGAPESPRIDATCSFARNLEDGTLATSCEFDPPPLDDNGVFVIDAARPNLAFDICWDSAVLPGCEGPSDTDSGLVIDGQVLTQLSDGTIGESGLFETRDLPAVNRVELAIPDSEEITHYRITVRKWRGYDPRSESGYSVLYLRRNADGSFDRCSAPTTTSLCPVSAPLDGTDGLWEWPETVNFGSPRLLVSVVKPSPCSEDCGVSGSGVEISRIRGAGLAEYEALGWFHSNSDGRLDLDLEPGDYRLTATPGDTYLQGFVDGVVDITIGESGLVTAVDGESITPAGTLAIALRNPNISGLALAGDEPAVGVWLEFWKWNSIQGRFEYTGLGEHTNELGGFGLILDDGRWQVTARQQWWDPREETLFLPGHQQFEVADGTLTRIGLCVVDQNLPCDSLSGGIRVQLGIPNITGEMLRIDPTTSELLPVLWPSVDVYRRDPDTGWYGQYPDRAVTRFDSNRFGMLLEPGTYRLTLSGSILENGFPARSLPATRKYLLVTEQGSCLIASDTETSCSTFASSIDLVFDPPNFQGQVRGSGQTWPASLVLQRYFPGSIFGFDTLNPVRGKTSYQDGRFGLRLDDGYYRLEVDPWPHVANNFSKSTLFIGISGSTWCVTTTVSGIPQECQSWQTGDFNIDLQAGNYEAEVNYFNGTSLVALPWGSVEVWRYDDETSKSLEQTVQARQNGRFSIQLDNDQYGSDPVVRYDVTVDPRWSIPSAGLVRRTIPLWLGDFDGDGSRDDVCSSAPVNGVCSAVVSGLQEITLTTGNFTARVVDASTGGNLVSGNVRAWGIGNQCWSLEVECHQTRFVPDGTVSFDLVPGRWVLEFSPQWNSELLVGRKIVIQVVSSSKWCLAEDFETSGVNCTQPANFEVELPTFNITARIEKNGQPVVGAWVSIEKKETDGSSTWWSRSAWDGQESSITRADGSFINYRPDGDYRIVISPPWDNPLGVRPFTTEFTVSAGVDDLPPIVDVPPSNLSFRLDDSQGSPVSRAFVYLEKWNPSGWWGWADMWSSSTTSGQVDLLVAASGRYRLVVEPRDQSGRLVRFTREFEVTVDGQGSLTYVNGALPTVIVVPQANLVGTVTTDGTTANDGGWIEVRQSGSYVTSSNVHPDGTYALYLDDGVYQVRFHPNYRDQASQPIDVEVVVAGGVVDSWRYASQVPSTNNCGQGVCEIDIDLSFDPPNVRVEVTVGGSGTKGVFIIFEGQVNGQTTSIQVVTSDGGAVSVALPHGTYQMTSVFAAADGTTMSSTPTQISVDGTTNVATPILVTL